MRFPKMQQNGPAIHFQTHRWMPPTPRAMADPLHCRWRRKMVEAGGVEPPSEKRYEPKPTCLSQFGVRPGPCGLIARSPAALRMSKKRNQLVRWFSPEPYGPKGPGQLTV